MNTFPSDLLAAIGESPHELVDQFVLARVLVDQLDTRVAKHCRDVAVASFEICRQLGIDTTTMAVTVVAGLIHDLGKADIPNALLEKPGKFTKAELSAVRIHPERSYARALDGGISEKIAKIAMAHHENVDGTGYPHGLSGDEIPLPARIVAVADRFVAMNEKRVYRDELPVHLIERVILEACSENKLDEDICCACLAAKDSIRKIV